MAYRIIAHFKHGDVPGGLVDTAHEAMTRRVNMAVYWQVYLKVVLAVNEAAESIGVHRRHHDHTAAFIDKVRGDP